MNKITLRNFCENDIQNKIKWINDPLNNKYLHYNIPLNYQDTKKWFNTIINNQNRHDLVMEYNSIPVGIIGIINIDKKRGEYYITLGDNNYARKGISYEATNQLLERAFNEYKLEKVWLCVDDENIPAKKLYEKVGFKQEGFLQKDIYARGKMVDRCIYGISKKDWSKQ